MIPTPIVDFIESHWSKMTDAKLKQLGDWLDRHGVRTDDVLSALDQLIDDGLEFTPKTPQLAKKLKAMGAIRPAVIGSADRGVIGRMKFEIVEGVNATVSLLPQWTYSGRLRSEAEQAQIYAVEDREIELKADGYWRDRLQAFRELLESEGAA